MMRGVKRTFRERVGDRFQFYRHQVRQWTHLSTAQQETSIEPKTIKSIEGAGNPRWDSMERYAKGLRIPLERILLEAMEATPAARQDEAAASPEAQQLLGLFRDLKTVRSRRLVLEMAERCMLAEQAERSALVPGSPEFPAETADRPESSRDTDAITKRARGR